MTRSQRTRPGARGQGQVLEDKARCYETRSEQGDYICQEQGTGQVGAGTWSGEVKELGQEKDLAWSGGTRPEAWELGRGRGTWPGAGKLGQEQGN